ncbi:uncharacterized protein LOC132057657 [Lycium ferocissimum]|uniref:uncharacterized protein LOC132057657 n=1 Tax=Lycium ferocissimum TaxID=112874 RepID=UPI00281689D9|nr:uncharacterized protein LOC132057657 [Lycium ferocissimum]
MEGLCPDPIMPATPVEACRQSWSHSHRLAAGFCFKIGLVGEDLWDVVNGSYTSPPTDGPKNSSAYKKWKQINVKAEFILKRSISHNLFDHIIRCKSATRYGGPSIGRSTRRMKLPLRILENELANTTQGNLSIAEYFLKIKNLCSEISLLNPDEAISEARMKRTIIRGLKSEYIPFVTSIQGWAQQPSLKEFENLLSSQELLAKQMAGVSIKKGEGNALAANRRNLKVRQEQSSSREMAYSQFQKGLSSPRQKEEFSNYGKKSIKCYRCGQIGHIKRYCRIKETNMAQVEKVAEEEEDSRCQKLRLETRARDTLAFSQF